MFQMNCMMDPIFCNTFRNLCLCNLGCEEDLCVTLPQGCAADTECSSQQRMRE